MCLFPLLNLHMTLKTEFNTGEQVEAIPADATRVIVDGCHISGEGRGLGMKMMRMAEEMGGYSPGNVNVPEKQEFNMLLRAQRTPQETTALLSFLNGKLRSGCKVLFETKGEGAQGE